jgi:predicted nucleic acid-binding protein
VGRGEREHRRSQGWQVHVDALLREHENLTLDAANVVQAALDEFRGSARVGFSDCLILANARAHNHSPVGTLDRKMAKLPGTQSPH